MGGEKVAMLSTNEIYEYIVEVCTRTNGVPPTVRLIGQRFGVTSTSHVQYHLKKLEKTGRIARVPNTQSYCVVGARWMAPEEKKRETNHGATF